MRDQLLAAAKGVRANAYAPYSVYQVGAAVLGSDGAVYTGCNVENVSFGLTLCAERAALAAMVGAGCRTFAAIAVVTSDGGTPCGMCRQVLSEFAVDGSVPVWCSDLNGAVVEHTVESLLPNRFRTEIAKGQ